MKYNEKNIDFQANKFTGLIPGSTTYSCFILSLLQH